MAHKKEGALLRHPPNCCFIVLTLVESQLTLVLHCNLRGSVKGGNQSGYGDVFAKEIPFRSPAESAGHMTRNNHGKLLVGEVAPEEEQVIVSLIVVPACINPSVNHGHFSQVVPGIEY